MGWQDFTQRVLPFMGADLLVSDLANKLAPSQVYTPTLENGYGGLVIATNAPSANAVITCQVVDATGIVPTWTKRISVDTLTPAMFVPPYSYTTASALRITLTSSVNQTINSTTFIWGTSSLAASMQGSKLVRPDGRDFPLGSNLADNFSNTAANVNVVPAPGAGLHILIASLAATGNGAAGNVSATIGGVTTGLISFVAAGVFPYTVPPGGLLLDANTPLTVAGGAGPTTVICSATYDIVS